MIKVKKCKRGVFVYLDTDIYVSKSLDCYGEYSEAELNVYQHFIEPGMTVLDVGAHIGATAIPLAKMVGPTGKVIAFEPQHYIYYHLCANTVLNNLTNVKCHNKAIGSNNKEVVMQEVDYLNQPCNFGGMELEQNFNGDKYPVPQVRIDDLKIECQFIKIDVEGMEQAVLDGAKATIEKYKPIVSLEAMHHVNDLFKLFNSWGYKLYLYACPLYNPNNFLENDENIFGKDESYEMLALPPGVDVGPVLDFPGIRKDVRYYLS